MCSLSYYLGTYLFETWLGFPILADSYKNVYLICFPSICFEKGGEKERGSEQTTACVSRYHWMTYLIEQQLEIAIYQTRKKILIEKRKFQAKRNLLIVFLKKVPKPSGIIKKAYRYISSSNYSVVLNLFDKGAQERFWPLLSTIGFFF